MLIDDNPADKRTSQRVENSGKKTSQAAIHPQEISTVLVTLQDKDVVSGPNSDDINMLMDGKFKDPFFE